MAALGHHRSLLRNGIVLLYDEISKKNIDKEIMIQADREFEQNEIKELNKRYNVHMFSLKVRGGKSFAVEQKIRDLKKLLCKTKALSKRLEKELNLRSLFDMIFID